MGSDSLSTCAAKALLYTASALSNLHAHSAMTPEALLLALLCDPALTDPRAPIAEEAELRRGILESREKPNADGWGAAAAAAYSRAWHRASERERSRPISERVRSTLEVLTSRSGRLPLTLWLRGVLTVGDLVHGLLGANALVDRVLGKRAIDLERFDREAPLPEVDYPQGLADDATVDVLAINDDVTPMPFVVESLQQHFGHDALRATYFTYRVDACGRARIATCERRLAESSMDAVYGAARAAGYPLALVYGARK